MLEFYSPKCEYCKELAPHYEQLAQELVEAKVASVVVSKVMCEEKIFLSAGEYRRYVLCICVSYVNRMYPYMLCILLPPFAHTPRLMRPQMS
jgi:thiol-disulfide isomerase/thioredoxin